MSTCPNCKTEFACGMREGPNDAPCWCTTLPPLPPDSYRETAGEAVCYCPRCLRALVEAAPAAPR